MDDFSPPESLTPKHVRAARALLAWSQQDLAKAAGVATSTVADFERGRRTPVANNAQAIRETLEGAEIRFLPTGAVVGPAVPRLAALGGPTLPVRWVTAEDLSEWANRTDGAFSLPTLLSHLVNATHGNFDVLRFPSEEGVRHPGWDGRTSTSTASTYVPEGEAGWEIGAQRNNISQKATDDYRKRTSTPAPIVPAESTFVFVTPRHWPPKDEWVRARQEEGVWREVRAYDANDLVHWIEQAPAVGLWLATRLGKRPPGTLELDAVWEEWSRATTWPLTEDLVLSDRDREAIELLRWLRAGPSVLSLQATTAEEVVAFFHATLRMLPDEAAAVYRSRSLVATTGESTRALASAPAPLIVLMTEPDPGLARTLAERGHFVLQAYDERRTPRGDVRRLARPSREGIASALVDAGISETRAEALARDSARNLAVLRRLMPSAPGRLPSWAQVAPPRALLAALLAGGWDEDSQADRARLAEIADMPYEAIVAELAPYVGDFDTPLRKIGSTWRVASPSDAWFLLAEYLTPADVGRFEAAAYAVLGSADPRFEMDPGERWMAPVRGVHREYSGMLRHGIGEVLILLALWGNLVRTVPEAGRRADAIVERLLRGADRRRWWSLSRDFRLLAEASPSMFLEAIEDSLDQDDPPIRALFVVDGGGVFDTEHLADLLWALESLAWSPDWLPRVTHVLARLDAIDDPLARQGNRPSRSLRDVHLLWNPQTYASLDKRLRALDLIRKRESKSAWKMMLGVLPTGHDSVSPTPLPIWRDFSVDKVEVVTYGLIARGAAAITERLLHEVGTDASRWSELVERFTDLAPGPEAGLTKLEAAESGINDPGARATLWAALRKLLNHHRQFADADWALPAEALGRMEAIYERLAPDDGLERVSWLFARQVMLPRPSSPGWEMAERDVDAARREAVRSVLSEGGVAAILALARQAEAPGYIGKALFDIGLSTSDRDAVLQATLRSDDPQQRTVAHGLIVSTWREGEESWADALVAKAKAEAWGDVALLAILHAFPMRRWTWDRVAEAGPRIEDAYWREAPILWVREHSDDAEIAIRKLLSVDRAHDALPLVERAAKADLPTDLIVATLRRAASEPRGSGGNEATMFRHYVAEILKILDSRKDVSMDALIELDWIYLPLLEYSPRPAKVLVRALSEQPALFVQMLSAVFKPNEDSGIVEDKPADPERASAIASQAYRLLDLWDRLPGTRDDGTIDGRALEDWIKEARQRARAVGREEIADSRIGHMLSASPTGTDGHWPAEAVREAIDLFRSRSMMDGFRIGKHNRRGVIRRAMRAGGSLERSEAQTFRTAAKAIAYEQPHTAKTLDALADDYKRQAREHDERAERLDWER